MSIHKEIEELRDSYELHQRAWAKRCLDNIEKEIEKLQYKANKYDSLVEKLEEIIDDDKMSDIEYQHKRELALKILEILKGENN